MYAQDCKHCGTASFPYHVEPIRCSQCLETDCVCTEDDLEEKKRHVDPNKPHMKELCHKCRAGIPCASNHEGSEGKTVAHKQYLVVEEEVHAPETDCVCTEEELEEKRLNIDPNKPHLSHLCLKCRAGKPCTGYRR
nr:hypothetical protein BaRGS_029238 [Batillaria attramentaria]